jgi:pimeloyl-ACP methyl ester carboxylesterase
MKRTILKRGDARLSVRDYGGDGNPIVLIHGLGGSQKSWSKVLAELGDRYRVITYDQRGHGASSRSSDYSWSTLVSDLAALITELELANFALAGHSLGAGVALEVASQTNQCRAVTMIDGAFPVELPPLDTSRLDRLEHKPILVLLRRVARLLNRGISMSFGDAIAIGEEYHRQFAAWKQALGQLTCPAQYLLGTKEEKGRNGPPYQEARRAAAELAVDLNALVRVRWIDTGHGMVRTQPHEVASALIGLEPTA